MSEWVEHTGDGTLVHGTSKEDQVLRDALKACGFRWSSNLESWYLPRTWKWGTRSGRVDELVTALKQHDREIRVEETRERERSSAEIHSDNVERAEARAERYADRADRAQTSSDELNNEARRLAEGIPLGQPILVGHHSETRDRNYRNRIITKTSKSVEEQKRADYWDGRAKAAASTAGGDSPGVIARRIEKKEAERRKIGRRIDGTDSPWDGPAEGQRLERLQLEAADLDEQIAFNKQLLVEAEKQRGALWTPNDIQKGDEVRVSSCWYPVLRVNKKTVTIPALIGMGSTEYSWTDTIPYNELKGRRRDGVVAPTPDDARSDASHIPTVGSTVTIAYHRLDDPHHAPPRIGDITVLKTDRLGCGCTRLEADRPGGGKVEVLTGCGWHDDGRVHDR